ncbi:hypothetical protein TSUD_194940 [Trifolium subterraneum]|nr:hypothetical protein TSUD_194940 [Trifolium subterraneum]
MVIGPIGIDDMRWIQDDGRRAKKGGGTTPQMGNEKFSMQCVLIDHWKDNIRFSVESTKDWAEAQHRISTAKKKDQLKRN